MTGQAKAVRQSSLISLMKKKGLKINLFEIQSMSRVDLDREIRKIKGVNKQLKSNDEGYSQYDKMKETREKNLKKVKEIKAH